MKNKSQWPLDTTEKGARGRAIMLQTLLRTRAGAIDMNIGRRTYPWPSARGPPLVRARTGPSSSGHGPELFLRRAVGQVGIGGVVPPGGTAVRIDVLPVMLNGPAGERVLTRPPVLPAERASVQIEAPPPAAGTEPALRSWIFGPLPTDTQLACRCPEK